MAIRCRVETMTVRNYHLELTRRLATLLGDRLLGVYAAGSFGLEDFDHARSDLDVFAVSRQPVSHEEKLAIVARLRHEALPCPARGLEFVLYPEETARVPTNEAGFLLNLNTGPAVAFRVDERPGGVERHWFPLDRAIVRESGVALLGPPPAQLFAAIPRALLRPVVRQALLWHLEPGRSGDDDSVLNACRSLRWLRSGVWSSKSEAGAWAIDAAIEPELVADALANRRSGADLGHDRVHAFLDAVLAEAGE